MNQRTIENCNRVPSIEGIIEYLLQNRVPSIEGTSIEGNVTVI